MVTETFPTIASVSGSVKKSSRPIQCMNTNCLNKLETVKSDKQAKNLLHLFKVKRYITLSGSELS